MKGIEFIINKLKFYYSKDSDFLSTFLELFLDKEIDFLLTAKKIIEINNKFEIKINKCLSEDDYFKTNRKKLSRMKTLNYKGLEYELNLSEPKHEYFYNLVTLYDVFNDSKEKTLSMSFKSNNID